MKKTCEQICNQLVIEKDAHLKNAILNLPDLVEIIAIFYGIVAKPTKIPNVEFTDREVKIYTESEEIGFISLSKGDIFERFMNFMSKKHDR